MPSEVQNKKNQDLPKVTRIQEQSDKNSYFVYGGKRVPCLYTDELVRWEIELRTQGTRNMFEGNI